MNNFRIHTRRSIRLKGYDYSQEGLYFITICVQDKICRFGHIENGKMIYNQYGTIAHNEWINTPNIRTNIILHEFVIMPNHIHGIIEITEKLSYNGAYDTPSESEIGEYDTPQRTDELHSSVRSHLRSPSQTIGAIVRGYKSAVTKQLNALGLTEKLWQRNYYEHIIRDEQSYIRITEYIRNNPKKWADDKIKIKK